MRLFRLAAVTALLFAVPAPALAVDHRRGTPGYCPGPDGVTVVVDFQDLGGDVLIRCAPGDPETGLEAVQNAGIEITGTDRWGLGFVCRLEGKPGPDAEPCIDTPPNEAHWGYWHASNGGSWRPSQYGLQNRNPPAGSFEGWSFSRNHTAGSNPAPRIAPVRPGQPVAPPPPPEAQDAPIPGRGGAPQPSAAPPAPPAAPTTSAAPTTTTPAAPPTTSVGGVAPGGVAWTGGESLPPASPEGGFPWGALIGGVGALVLGSAAGFVAWRRRGRGA
ncbi:hypothetical protein [Amycolatopsis anabasis]|uniref:hypothetical protein n=1 Tax=Amycolatopsis anabasis TaxID=1840409 RepID=UPI00131C7518|nr:hypothetical protein [Amycolatopsis anabasis]